MKFFICQVDENEREYNKTDKNIHLLKLKKYQYHGYKNIIKIYISRIEKVI